MASARAAYSAWTSPQVLEGGAEDVAAVSAEASRCEETADTRVLDFEDVTPLSVPMLRGSINGTAPVGKKPATAIPRLSNLTIASRIDAMRHEEAGRIHVFSWLVVIISLFALLLVPVLGGDPLARGIFIGAIAVTLVGYGTLTWSSRTPASFDPHLAGAMFLVHALAANGVSYYFGVFSPCAAILAIALYVFALGSSMRHVMGAYLSIAIGQALLAGGIVTGIIDDRGLINAEYLSVAQQVGVHLCVQMIFLIALLLGRMGRQRTVRAVCELERAVREVARRDALLNEARLALAGAEKDGPGRFSDEIVGSFRLGDIIGRGAMGEVYEAEHLDTGKHAAVKLLRVLALSSPCQLARFVREARVAASLSAPNLVRVLEVADMSSPMPYLAMEKLEGRDLWHILRERARLSMSEVLDMVEQVSAGLRVMGAAGIVHRDLKPQNVFLAEQDGKSLWKLLDFGVSKLSDEQSSLTNGQVVGTPAYMAPEQARGLPVDHRADLYSLAVIVYRCLTGRPAFSGPQIPQVLYQVTHEMPLQPSKLTDLPPDIDAVLAIAMAKDPSERFGCVIEFALRLDEAARGQLAIAVRDRATALLQRHSWRREV